MASKNNELRRNQILAATLVVLREFGVKGASTARIARQARCSKETIYNWFGDRSGLFSALVEAQSASLNVALKQALASNQNSRENLISFCAALLDLLTGQPSVLINRAAIGEIGRGNELASALLERGRNQTAPLVFDLLEKAQAEGLIEFQNSSDVFKVLFGLLISERQIGCLLGAESARPPGGEMNMIARTAVDRLFLIFQPGNRN